MTKSEKRLKIFVWHGAQCGVIRLSLAGAVVGVRGGGGGGGCTDMAPHALQYAAGVASVAMLPVSTYCAMQFAFEFAAHCRAQPETDANEV